MTKIVSIFIIGYWISEVNVLIYSKFLLIESYKQQPLIPDLIVPINHNWWKSWQDLSI